MTNTPLINIFTYQLPGSVTRSIYLEYNGRKQEIERILSNPDNNYKELIGYENVLESLLALSLFYRNVIGYLQGATAFYYSVNKKSEKRDDCPVKVGNVVLDVKQQRRLTSMVFAFNAIKEKYQLTPSFFEFSETIQFLRNCKELFNTKAYEEDDSV